MDESPGKMYALASVMLVLAILPVALRFYVRITQKQGLQLDDWLIVPAMIGAAGTAAAIYDATALGGLGGHTQIDPNGMPIFTPSTMLYLKANFVTLLTQMVSFGSTKLSVLFFYRRLFRGKAFFNVASWIMIGVVSVWTIAFFFAHLLQCVPIEANWMGSADLSATCVNELMMYIAETWSDVMIDAIILILPMPIIWNLQMTVQRKLALSGIFLLGALTILSSVARLIVYYNIEAQLNAGGVDMAWIIAPTFYWPMIESSLGILGACLPTLRPLFKGFSPESVMRSFRGIMSLDSSRASRSQPSMPDPAKQGSGDLYVSTSQDPRSARSTDKDNWSFYSDAESFGYYAEISAKSISAERTHDIV